jgi:hypothetical protein
MRRTLLRFHLWAINRQTTSGRGDLAWATVLTSDAVPPRLGLARPFPAPERRARCRATPSSSPDGVTFGAVQVRRPDWPIGSVIYRGDEPNLRVAGVSRPTT